MGIFDDIGRKVSKSSQNVINKTKDMASVSSLNSQITELEKAIKSFFIQLGEKYYEKFGDSPDEELLQLCSSITESKEKIKECRQEIIKIKKIRICPKCGAECDDSLSFCGACGTELPKPESQGKKFCTNCGHEISTQATFCPQCGNKIN